MKSAGKKAGGKKVGVVDYGTGNLASVSKALERAGAECFLAQSPAELKKADFLVLPGVGHFAAGMRNLADRGLDDLLLDWATAGKPLLGICLGMQLLFDESEEGSAKGLGIIPGKVVKLNGGQKIPHMGWNSIEAIGGAELFEQFSGRSFYFVHSYVCATDKPMAGALTNYGNNFVSAVQAESVAGVQFHPEKSSADGIEMLRCALGAPD
ncbi:MAG: imidazole glycerol phosphate synthase subunit HisH [Actinomycetota bacterium]